MNAVVETKGLTKDYGKLRALSHVDISVQRGQVFGLLGPNGSGKTTFLSTVMGLTRPTSGKVQWFGEPLKAEALQKIGTIIEKPNFYPYMSGQQNLELAALIKKADKKNIAPAVERVGLTADIHRRYAAYSLGMKQRLAIASTLINHAEVVVLDEPTNGLDPTGIMDIRNLIVEIAREGKTVLLASHLLDEAQKVCSHFAVLNKGKLIHSSTINELQEGNEVVALGVEKKDETVLPNLLKEFSDIVSYTQKEGHYIIALKKGAKSHALSAFLLEKKIAVTHFSVRRETLEKKFLKIIKKPV